MRSAFGRLPVLALLLLAAACASTPRTGTASRRDSSLISREQIRERSFNNAWDAVETLNGNWLHARGSDSFSTPTQIWVYVDDTKYGGVESLRTIPASDISYIRRLDGIAATARWGLGHGQGVILVSTRPQ